jgi:hypothetical protein
MCSNENERIVRRHMFGGAISLEMPERFVDVSSVRPLNDSQVNTFHFRIAFCRLTHLLKEQECWVDADTDQSIVVEILGYNEDISDSNSAQFYWEDNAQCNDAEGQHNAVHITSRDISAEVGVCADPPATSTNGVVPTCWLISGVQQVAKFKEQARNTLAVHIAVLRLPHVETDIVIHYNQPLELSADSSSASVARAASNNEQAGAALGRGSALTQEALVSLRIHDWGLFSAPSESEEDESND